MYNEMIFQVCMYVDIDALLCTLNYRQGQQHIDHTPLLGGQAKAKHMKHTAREARVSYDVHESHEQVVSKPEYRTVPYISSDK